MNESENNGYVRAFDGPGWVIGNDSFEMTISLNDNGLPVISRLTDTALPDLDRSGGSVIGPVIEAGDEIYRPGSAGMSFLGAKIDEDRAELCLCYGCDNGLQARHYLTSSPNKAVWRCRTTLTNESDDDVGGIRRFDALNMDFSVSGSEPLAAYLLGWLDGPRLDAPGKHATPFPYASWIPRLLYGDGAPAPPPPPPGGWASPSWRLIKERLTKLPLRSGKRSTYDNHPWVTVLDPGREAGFFTGFEWSGIWKIDVEHHPEAHTVSLYACTDACVHTLKSGESLDSPPTFTGFFTGDWDDAFNACRRYVGDEIYPSSEEGYPPIRYNLGCPRLPGFTSEYLRAEIDAAADAGIQNITIDAMWWDASLDNGDFSIGLGDFSESRKKFPDGLRAVSDYLHERGMTFGLWAEFERVDIRTAGKGPYPWSPDWLIHQQGHAYRSWCQHVYLMCLGVRDAADWALKNMSRMIEDYGVDWLKIDGNEWAVCDDPSHDHGATDGDWAQTQGLLYVMKNLHERFPDLIIENCAGGSQRADTGMAHYCKPIQVHDRNRPSALVRRYSHGAASIYPCHSPLLSLSAYPPDSPLLSPDASPPECTLQQLEWRLLSRMMGSFDPSLELTTMGPEHLVALKRAIVTYKKLRPSLHGDRYVMDEPAVVFEPELKEADNWEVYEYLSPDATLISVFFYRCMSPEPEHRAVLRGLDERAEYRIETHTGQLSQTLTGAELMQDGIVCRLPNSRSAEVMILTKV